MMTQEAILYYADHPADFVEDLLHVTPDKNQRAILDSVAKNQMTSVRSGHGIGKSAVEAWTVIWFMSTGHSQKSLAQPRRSISYSIFCGQK